MKQSRPGGYPRAVPSPHEIDGLVGWFERRITTTATPANALSILRPLVKYYEKKERRRERLERAKKEHRD